MAKVTLLVLSRGAAVDRFSNSLSIFEIIENVEPDSFPAIIPKVMVVATAVSTSSDEGVVEADLVFRTEDEELVRGKLNFNFSGNTSSARSIVEMPGLPIVEPKDIIVEVLLPGSKEHSASTRLKVGQKMSPAALKSKGKRLKVSSRTTRTAKKASPSLAPPRQSTKAAK